PGRPRGLPASGLGAALAPRPRQGGRAVIRASDRVASVLAQDERLLDVFVAASPAFEKLRSSAMRKTMARLVTVEQAARIAGIDPAALLGRLNEVLGGAPAAGDAAWSPEADTTALAPVPDALRALPDDRLVDLDVREDLR